MENKPQDTQSISTKEFREFVEEFKKSTKLELASSVLRTSYTKEIARDDDDKRTKQIDLTNERLEKIQKALDNLAKTLKNSNDKIGNKLDNLGNKQSPDFKPLDKIKDTRPTTLKEELKSTVAGAKRLGSSIVSGVRGFGERLTNARRTPMGDLDSAGGFINKIGATAQDILGTSKDYTIEGSRFGKAYSKATGGSADVGMENFNQLAEKEKEIKAVEERIKQQTDFGFDANKEDKDKLNSLKKEYAEMDLRNQSAQIQRKGIDSKTQTANAEADNIESPAEIVAEASKDNLDLTKQLLDTTKESLTELKAIREAVTATPSSTQPSGTSKPAEATAAPQQESGGIGSMIGDAVSSGGIGKKAAGFGGKLLGGLKAGGAMLGKGALTAGKLVGGALLSKPALIAGGVALAGYGAYKGYQALKDSGIGEKIGDKLSGVGDSIKGAYNTITDSYSRGLSGKDDAEGRLNAEVEKRMAEQGVEPFSDEANKIRKEVRAEMVAADPNAFVQSEQKLGSKTSFNDNEIVDKSGTQSTSDVQKGITSEKSLFGSSFLGGLISKKGTETGRFLSDTSNYDSFKGKVEGRNLDTSEYKSATLLGKRTSGGIFGADKYEINDVNTAESFGVDKTTYNKIQGLVKEGKSEEAQKVFADYKEQYGNEQGSGSPEEMLTPVSEGASNLAAVSPDKPSIFSRIKDKFNYAKTESLVSAAGSFDPSETVSKEGVLEKSNLQQGSVEEKSLFGSKFLGSLFSKKGETAGTFLTNQEKAESFKGDIAGLNLGSDLNVDYNKAEYSGVLGKRISSGSMFKRDKYSMYDTQTDRKVDVSKKDYMKVQALAKQGKAEEAKKLFDEIRDREDAYIPEAASSPEQMLTPVSKGASNLGAVIDSTSKENLAMKDEMSTSKSSQPIVSNNVQTSNNTNYVPIKADPRPLHRGSALDRYNDRVAAY